MDSNTAQVIALARSGVASPPWPGLPRLAPQEWARISALAIEGGVASLVWRALACDDGEGVPHWVGRSLLRHVQQGVGEGLLREHALGRLLETLAAQQIEVIVLKGAALAYQLYPRPELRPYGDIDVLVRPGDYARLYRVLRAEGYETGDEAGVLKANRSPLESYFPRPFVSPIGRVLVEVHFDLLQFGLFEEHSAEFWRESLVINAAGVPIRVLCPEHQVLQLAAHVHRHSYGRLIWLMDLDLAVRRWGRTVDWARVMAFARDEGMGTLLRYALSMAHMLLNTPQPDLGPWRIEERLLFACYRRLWPRDRLGATALEEQRHRLSRFYPETGDWRDTLPGLVLLGRRRAKVGILRRYWRAD